MGWAPGRMWPSARLVGTSPGGVGTSPGVASSALCLCRSCLGPSPGSVGASPYLVGASSALCLCRSFLGLVCSRLVWSRLVRFLLGLVWSRLGLVRLAMGRELGCGLGLAPSLVGLEQLVNAVTAAA